MYPYRIVNVRAVDREETPDMILFSRLFVSFSLLMNLGLYTQE